MKFIVLVLFSASFFLPPVCFANDIEKLPVTELTQFYPVGSQWKEKVTKADGSQEIMELRVLPLTTYEGIKVIPLLIIGEDKIKLYEKKSWNFIALKAGGKVIMSASPTDGRYRWPLSVGKKWNINFKFHLAGRKDITVPKHYEVEAFEKITVPAGTFESFRVKGVSGGKVKNVILLWWAPKVNMTIKIEHFRGKQRIISYETVSLPQKTTN